MTKYIVIGSVVAVLLLGGIAFGLWKYDQGLEKRLGSLETSNKQLSETVKAKTNATQGRAQVDQSVRALAPADVLDKLR